MKNTWTLRENFKLIDRIAISRQTFEWSYVKKKYKLNVTNFHILRASFNSPFSTHLLPFF